MLKEIVKHIILRSSPQTRKRLMDFLLRIEDVNSTTIHPLESAHLKNCIVLPNRIELLKTLREESNQVAELGVFKGEFSASILEYSRPNKLYLIDNWENLEQYKEVNRKFSEKKEIEIIRGDSVEELMKLKDKSLDWVYIDTSHTYEMTFNELLAAEAKVKGTGYICGHDYTIGNWKYRIKYGVIEAVNEFCISRNYRVKYITIEPLGHNSFALEKIM